MTRFQEFLTNAPSADLVALALILLSWLIIGHVIEHPPKNYPSVGKLMEDYRREWMRVMVSRVPRLFDVSLISSLRQGTTFFVSASMLAIGGSAALIGNNATVQSLTSELPIDTDQIELTLKILLPVGFMANALLKFIWAHRLFGYCAILMAAVPNDPMDAAAYPRAAQAAEINCTAAKSYNRGLRSVYFALAGMGWLFGAYALILATIITAGILLRREFWSQSRGVILCTLPTQKN